MNPFLGPIIDVAGSVLKRILPAEKMSESERAKVEQEFKLALLTQEDKVLATKMSAILAEAKSSDPWTSRARPSFLYVMYALILASIPMGVLTAINLDIGADIAIGMKSWLGAIPDMLWGTFGAGYLGYAGARTYEKSKILGKK